MLIILGIILLFVVVMYLIFKFQWNLLMRYYEHRSQFDRRLLNGFLHKNGKKMRKENQ